MSVERTGDDLRGAGRVSVSRGVGSIALSAGRPRIVDDEISIFNTSCLIEPHRLVGVHAMGNSRPIAVGQWQQTSSTRRSALHRRPRPSPR